MAKTMDAGYRIEMLRADLPVQQRKLRELDERIGRLMTQRADAEDKLANTMHEIEVLQHHLAAGGV